MQKISEWTDLVTPAGEFRYGSLTGGEPPTPLKAEWLNQVQAELANFILASLPTLDAADSFQLLKAAQKMISNLAVQATTLAGYGITDAYTKAQADLIISGKANWAITLAGYGINDAYTKSTIDAYLQNKADKVTVDQQLMLKQDKSTALMAVNGWHLDKATGRLEQWGSGVVAPDSVSQAFDFPTPFAEVYNCFGNKVTPNSQDDDANSAGAFFISPTQYKLFNDTVHFAATVHWRAIGRAPGY